MNTGVYSITAPSGKRYIGSSVNLAKRWTQHQYFLKKEIHHNRHLQNAWNKYEGKLEFKSLIICEPKDLLMYEQLIIDGLNPEYNIAKHADKANYALGVKRSQETKDKISKALKGKNTSSRPQTRATKDKLRLLRLGSNNPMYGKTPWNKKNVTS